MDISVAIATTYFKFLDIVLDICMEGMVSQIAYTYVLVSIL